MMALTTVKTIKTRSMISALCFALDGTGKKLESWAHRGDGAALPAPRALFLAGTALDDGTGPALAS